MNIYCVIFMCTFGSNNTNTEMGRGINSLESGAGSLKNQNGTDVASLILPGKGVSVPQTGDIVMDLPKVNSANAITSQSRVSSATTPTRTAGRGPLSDILLPPALQRNQGTRQS